MTIGTDVTPHTAAVLQLLELATPRLAELMGIQPEIAQVFEGGPDAATVAPVVYLQVGAATVGLGVIPPSEDLAEQVAKLPTVIAEHLASALPARGIPAEIAAGGNVVGEPVLVEYVASDRPVGTLVVWAGEELTHMLAQAPPGAGGTDIAHDDKGAAAVTTDGPPTEAAAAPPGVASPSGTATAPPLAALGNLSQVELNVTVELGSTELTIRELLDLAPGSVVRVGTQIGEPFRILVNGRLAATGDLVVVNGRLGVRIREVIAS